MTDSDTPGPFQFELRRVPGILSTENRAYLALSELAASKFCLEAEECPESLRPLRDRVIESVDELLDRWSKAKPQERIHQATHFEVDALVVAAEVQTLAAALVAMAVAAEEGSR